MIVKSVSVTRNSFIHSFLLEIVLYIIYNT